MRRIARRVALPGVCIVSALWWNAGKGPGAPREAGAVIACDSRLTVKQPRMLAFGLENPRGVAYDAKAKAVWVVEGKRRLLVKYLVDEGRYEELPKEQYPCPDGPCETTDQRGVDATDCAPFVADHVRMQFVRRTERRRAGCTMEYDPWYAAAGPSGLVLAEVGGVKTLFTTEDRPWTEPPGPASALPDSVDYSRWRDKQEPRPFGEVRGQAAGGVVTTISQSVRHPSGIALAPGQDKIYVTESDADGTRWRVFENNGGAWQDAGVLGAAAAGEAAIPAFRGMAACGELVFAGGPDGLYVFLSSGAALGRVAIDDVTGVSCGESKKGKRMVYFAAGHALYGAKY